MGPKPVVVGPENSVGLAIPGQCDPVPMCYEEADNEESRVCAPGARERLESGRRVLVMRRCVHDLAKTWVKKTDSRVVGRWSSGLSNLLPEEVGRDAKVAQRLKQEAAGGNSSAAHHFFMNDADVNRLSRWEGPLLLASLMGPHGCGAVLVVQLIEFGRRPHSAWMRSASSTESAVVVAKVVADTSGP